MIPRDIFIGHIKNVYRDIFTYHTRTSRVEFWCFSAYYLAIILAGMILMLVDALETPVEIIYGIVNFIHLFVVTSLFVRRLHDTNRSGFRLLLGFVPFIGPLILLYYYCQPGQEGLNRYGKDPLTFEHAPGQEII